MKKQGSIAVFKKYLVPALIVIYLLFLMTLVLITSTSEAEFFIDGVHITNICKAMQAYVEDDFRAEGAILTLVLSIPILLYCFFAKFKVPIVNLFLLIFIIAWIWFFIYQYKDCPLWIIDPETQY